jgi:hydrogenase-4 component E
MTYLLISFLAVAVAPLVFTTWRTSLLGLALQGLLMSAIFLERGWPATASGAVLLVDLFVLRTLFVPWWLHRILRRQNVPRRNDVIPANLLSWSAAATLVFLAFQFAGRVSPGGGEEATHVAVAAAALLLAFLVLATQRRTFGQAVGALRLENAIALFELAGGHALPLPVQLAATAVLVLTVLTFGAFVRRAGAGPAAAAAAAMGQTP